MAYTLNSRSLFASPAYYGTRFAIKNNLLTPDSPRLAGKGVNRVYRGATGKNRVGEASNALYL
jgi:hypothetical protein